MIARKQHHRYAVAVFVVAAVLVGLASETAWAADTSNTSSIVEQLESIHPKLAKLAGQLTDPWFIFGMTAQSIFFMRFFVQWIASEKKRRSTVPVAFWWLSLVGGLSLFVYAFHRDDLVIMTGQLLGCVIYIRNLMLISNHKKRRKQAGLPTDDLDAKDEEPSTLQQRSSCPHCHANTIATSATNDYSKTIPPSGST